MASDAKTTPTDQERIAKLEQQLRDAWVQIGHMQRMGGFADAKTLGTRCTRIETRLELVELDGEMLKDVAAHTSELVEDHLRDRHDSDLDRDSAIDATAWRKIRRRMRVWAEKRGLMTARRDVAGVRQSENRLRPTVESSGRG